MHDLARFILHFYFFFGVTVFQERIDVWQQVESDGVRKNCSSFAVRSVRFVCSGWDGVAHRAAATGFLIFGPCFCLTGQLFNTSTAAARDCLIARSENPTHAENLV